MTRPILDVAHIHPAIRSTVAEFQHEIVTEVQQAIAAHPVVVVGMKQNPFPKKARKALDAAGIADPMRGRPVAATGDALEHVAGYCVVNDVSERNYQLERGGQWDKGKSCETFNPLGPWLVTADEIPDPDNVPLRIFVNGEKKQESNTSMLIFDCKKLIEWGSTFYTWHPGDVLFTGTPEGVSPVKPGDTMRAVIDPIGEMTVPVRAHKAG